jgi:hypothetical protein
VDDARLRETTMKTVLYCPCGEKLSGPDEDALVERAREHLREAHPGLEYEREEILALAEPAP